MRIALVSRELAPFAGGGIGTYVLLMARALRDAGHEVHVVTAAHPDLERRGAEVLPGVTLTAVRIDSGEAAREAYACDPMRYAMAVYEALRALHQRAPLEAVEFPEYLGEGWFALQAKRHAGEFAGTVLAVRLHTPSRDVRALNDDRWFDRDAAAIDHLEAESIAHADLLLSPTRALLDRALQRVPRAGPSEVVVHPFDAELGGGSARGASLATPRVLYFGRLERRKGVALLLEAAQRLWAAGLKFDLRMVGSDTPTGPDGGSMRAHLQARLAPRWSDRLQLVEGMAREALAVEIAQATVCCFPSLWENFPNTCLEAMAGSKPVVVSDGGGMAEIVEEGRSGVVFRSGDVDALVTALRRVLEDAGLRERLAAGARQRVLSLCDAGQVAAAQLSALSRVRREAAAPAVAPPRVSVVIDCDRSPEGLAQTLRSVRAQTLPPAEVLLVTARREAPELDAARIAPGDRIFRPAEVEDAGVYRAAIQQARGEWVLRLASGDRVDPEYLGRTSVAVQRDPEVSLVTTCARAGDVPWGLLREVLPALDVSGIRTALVRRSVLLELDEETLRSDWTLACELAAHDGRAAVIPWFAAEHTRDVRPPDAAAQARVLARFPALSPDPSRTQRLLLAEAWRDARVLLERDRHPPLRYRVADGVDALLRRLPGAVPLARMVKHRRGR